MNLFAGFALSILLAAPAEEDGLTQAKALYLKAVQGDHAAAGQAQASFKRLMETSSDDAVLLAYSGSLQVLQSGHTLALWKKGRLAKQGLSSLDTAVSRAPENPEVRFLRAISTVHLPGMFRREDQCSADLAWLAARANTAVASGALDRRYAALALYHHGETEQKHGRSAQAIAAWNEAVKIAPDSRGGVDAARRLHSR